MDLTQRCRPNCFFLWMQDMHRFPICRQWNRMYYCLGKFAVVTDILLLPLEMCSISVLKLYRVTKSSLSPEVVALSNGIDIGIFIRVLAIELLTGIFMRDLIDTHNSYSVLSPFGLSHCEEDTNTLVMCQL